MIRILAAISGLLGVGIGAFGAHGVSDPQARAWIATGAVYGLVHAVSALWASEREPWVARLWIIGALLFSGSLYAIASGLPRSVAMVAPVGGTLMLAGWAWFLVTAVRRK
ncbi:MAG: DUF423 domain-containing protein [Sphingomonadaceae bacterium]